MRKQLPWFEILLSVVVLSAYVYAAFSDAYNLPNRWFIRDDAYYYFKVAQNISEGHGSTFDGIHPTNGYHPLWLLVCIPIFALARYDLILPLRILVVVTGALQVSTAILLYRLVRSVLMPLVGMLAASYWVFSTYILVFLYKTGVESSIALFFIVLLLYLSYRFERTWRLAAPSARQLSLLAAVAALAVFSRLDLIFFALIMGIWLVLRASPLRYLLPLDLLVVFVSVLAAFLLRLGFANYYDAATEAISMSVLGMLIKIPVFYALRLYDSPASWKAPSLILRIGLSVIVSSAALSVVLFAGSAVHILPTVSRAILTIDAGLTLAGMLLIRLVAYLFRRPGGKIAAMPPLAELRSRWRTWLREGTIYYGIVGGSLALYMIWNRLAFGDLSPVSGQVKRWWGTFLISVYGGPARTWLSFFALDPYGDFNAWQPSSTLLRDLSNRLLYHNSSKFGNPTWQQNFIIVVTVTLIAIVLALLLTRQKSVRSVIHAGMIPLFVGSSFQALSYNATGYASPKEWYWLTQPVLLILVGALLIHVPYDLLLKRWLATRLILWISVGIFVIGAGASYWRDALALYSYGQAPANAPYAEVVPFLEAHTHPGDIIGMTGGGNVGYFLHDRTIVNMDGLINSVEYFKNLQAGTGSDYLYASGMRYVFANPGILTANPYRGQYEGRLEAIASWGGKDLMKFLQNSSE